ncbi:MAG: inorganic phosphate transporter [Bacteroidaceae bacterium]
MVVGVANDAVNFLNSAIGSRIASRRVILSVAAIGILIGTLTSSGMMEVARSGVFYPAEFNYQEMMILFLGMIVGDILLLDVFNTLGLPTSTTVSMVFGLLGSAVAIALHNIHLYAALSIVDISKFINSGKALVIISAILLSVVISFVFGVLFMYLSRLIFSFRYRTMFSRFGSLWCGISFTGIIWFAVFKGLKGSGLISSNIINFVSTHSTLVLIGLWLACSLLLFALQQLKVNILRITILMGTFSLALAFAGNDLVNFIGVPLAGFDAYKIAQQAGSQTIQMGALMNPAQANVWLLGGAGVVMVFTLFFSRKAMKVTQTELSLSSQTAGHEQFGSTLLARQLVRAALTLNTVCQNLVPRRLRLAIATRFEQLPVAERGNVTYDLIRATVNLSAASILISLATSYKLPLSTTYVVFMIAMGSSLADKAWGRESAVYRITGVVTVISGWFLTAIAAFTITFSLSSLFIWTNGFVIVAVVVLCLVVVVRSNCFKKKDTVTEDHKEIRLVEGTTEEVLYGCTEEVVNIMEQVTRIYNRTLVAVFKENRKVLKAVSAEADTLCKEASERKHNIVSTLQMLQNNNIDTGHFYVQIVDYISEVTKALVHITRPAYEYIDNNHKGLSKEQVFDLMSVNNDVEQIFDKINELLRSKDFSHLDVVLDMRDKLFDNIADAIKKQLRRINSDTEAISTRGSMLYLNVLSETKTMVLQARNLLKSQRYFIEHKE